jgi:3-oxoacyl-[acyl-carrier-protein] synthase III
VRRPRILAIAYELGQQECSYEQATGFGTVKMPNIPAMWGWGKFHQCTSSPIELIVSATRKALVKANLEASDIGCVVFTRFVESADQRAEREFLETLALVNAYPIYMNTAGCDAMLSGVSIGGAMVGTLDRRSRRPAFADSAGRSPTSQYSPRCCSASGTYCQARWPDAVSGRWRSWPRPSRNVLS